MLPMKNGGKTTCPGLPSHVSDAGTNLVDCFAFVLEKWSLVEHREVDWELENWLSAEEQHLLLLLSTQCLLSGCSRSSGNSVPPLAYRVTPLT